jgi:hypothetical protein
MVARGEEPRLDQPRPAPPRALNVESVAQWLKGLYSEAEFRALAPGAIAFEARQGDLILRPDQRELQVSFVHLALRQGDLYCGFEPGGECHGRFADVCDFTDFRYGDDLAPYFPTCKSGDD